MDTYFKMSVKRGADTGSDLLIQFIQQLNRNLQNKAQTAAALHVHRGSV